MPESLLLKEIYVKLVKSISMEKIPFNFKFIDQVCAEINWQLYCIKDLFLFMWNH